MPEGDTIYKAARTLQRALAGQIITRFETVLVHLARVDDQERIVGRTIDRVEAIGKHLLIVLSGDLILRTHMRMNGSWHIYRPGERWQLPTSAMRIRLETAEWVAVAFKVHVAEFLRSSDLLKHSPIARLGPDVLAPDFDRVEALARIRARGETPIAEVLLDQRALAGIGNVYKSEVLFLARIHPDESVAALDDQRLREIVETAVRVMRDNITDKAGPGIVTYRGLRRTTGRMKPEDRLWVYGRGGRPCRKCGTPIEFRKSGLDARVTYWCPSCQPRMLSR